MIDEVDEDLENLEVALSNEASPGKRRRRLSLLVIVSTVITLSAFPGLDAQRILYPCQELALAIKQAMTLRKTSKK